MDKLESADTQQKSNGAGGVNLFSSTVTPTVWLRVFNICAKCTTL